MTVKGLTQSALAKALSLTEGRVSQLKSQGMPTHSVQAAQAWREVQQNVAARKPAPSERAPSTPPTTVPPTVGVGVLKTQEVPSTSPTTVPPTFPPLQPGELGDEDFQMARTRREIAEANLAEMREAELDGKLIRVDAIRAAWAKRIASTRDALMQLPHRLAPVLAAETDMETVSRVLDEELRQALTELSRDAVGKLEGAA